MPEMHLHGCCCAGCLGYAPGSTSDGDTPDPPGSGGATRPVYSSSQIARALTTADGDYSSVAWTGQRISFSIGTGKLSPGDRYWESEYDGYVPMSSGLEAAAREAFRHWDDIIAIDLVERSNDPSARISFNYTSNSNGGTYAEYGFNRNSADGRASNTLYDTDLWFAHNWWTHDKASDLIPGGYGMLTFLHEIGHALGLSHPGGYNISASYAADATHFQDTRAYSVMSYFDANRNGSGTDHFGTYGPSYGATPLLHDIMVLQSIYGADMTTRTYNSVYGFNSNTNRAAFDFSRNPDPVIAIWDAGGIDKIDASGWNTNQVVDLTQGAFSSVGHLTHNLAIAYGTTIELATTGGGNDRILGNGSDNVLTGNGGRDTLTGDSGHDIFYGGPGADRLFGGSGQDWARYSDSTAGVAVNLATGQGSGGYGAGDILEDIEHLYGSRYGDTLTGDDLTANRLLGDGGNDRIFGGGGDDFLLGQNGDDQIFGGDGRDLLRGGAGADHLDGGSGDDWAQYHDSSSGVSLDLTSGGTSGAAQGDTFVSIEHVRGTRFDDHITGNASSNILLGSDGDDFLFGGDGDDFLYGGAGADRISGGAGNDWADYSDASSGVAVSLATGTGTAGAASGDQLDGIEWLQGSDFHDTLEGDDAANMIRGGAGGDTITGHGGNDILTGDTGADVFIFNPGDGVDRINAFDPDQDRLRLSDTSFAELTIFTFRGDAAIGYHPGDTILLSGIDETAVTSGTFLFS